jgi:hypothetical protein
VCGIVSEVIVNAIDDFLQRQMGHGAPSPSEVGRVCPMARWIAIQ